MAPPKYEKTHRVGTWMTLHVGTSSAVRSVQLDDLEWSQTIDYTDIGEFLVAVCPFGGPIAMASMKGSTEVTVFNSTGVKVAGPQHVAESNIIHLAWNERVEQLIVVSLDGTIYFYTQTLAQAAASIKLESPRLFAPLPLGLAVIQQTSSGLKGTTLECQVLGSGEYRTRTVNLDEIEELPSCFVAISSETSESGYDEFIIAPSDNNTLFKIQFSTAPRLQDKLPLIDACIVSMALSPVSSSGGERRLACIDTQGNIYICLTDIEDVTKIWETGCEEPPADFLFCGEKCVAWSHLSRQFDSEALFDSMISFIDVLNPPEEGEEAEYSHDVPPDFRLFGEVDGIRLLSADQHQFIQQVPLCSYRAFKDLKSPASRLITAYDQFMEEDPTSVSTLRHLTQDGTQEKLVQAIQDCINTAASEFSVAQQQRLMRVASYGKSFCPTFDTDDFSAMCQRLRVVNAVREPSIGMLITMEQYKVLEGDALTTRLVAQGHHQLAFNICRHLGLPPDDVIVKWAKRKILSSAPDAEVAAQITDKMALCKGLSLRPIAEAAYHNGKEDLAVRLLEADPYAENQVHVLLQMHYEEMALQKAVESGAMDLVFYVITQCLYQRGSAAVKTIMRQPIAKSMLLTLGLASKSTRDYLDEYHKQNPEYEAFLSLINYLKQEERMFRNHIKPQKGPGSEMIQDYKISAIQTAHAALAPVEQHKTTCKALKLQQKLLEYQLEFVGETKKLEFLNASVSETIQLLIVNGKVEKADKLRVQFGINDKMYAWCRLKSLIQAKNWDEIDKMGGGGPFKLDKKIKSPIGFSPFVTELVKVGEKLRAAGFIHRVPEIIERMELYSSCEAWEAAARDCIEHKEYQMIPVLQDRARSDPKAVELMERLLRQARL